MSIVLLYVATWLLILCYQAARRLITGASRGRCAARARLGSSTVVAGPAPSIVPTPGTSPQEQA